MLLNRLRAFIAEMVSGLPVGAAACAALGLFGAALVTPLQPSLDADKVSAGRGERGPVEERIAVNLRRNENFSSLLRRFGLHSTLAHELWQQLYSVVDLRRMPRDQAFSVIVDRRDNNVRAVEFVLQDYLVRANVGLTGWSVEREELAHVTSIRNVRVRVADNFGKSAERAGLSPARIGELQNMFISEIDLLGELAAGDEVLLVAPQKQYLNGHVSQDPVAAVRVVHGGRLYDAFGFRDGDGPMRYYDTDGYALPRAFLAAPLKYDRISSRFDLARPDPASSVMRPHEAIDYQAAQGTPVFAVGSAKVEFAGWRPGYGLLVELKHAGGYSSTYAHLSRIADDVVEGRVINAGAIIGEVGQTGYATGPHLHFEFTHDGTKLDYLSIKIPSTEVLSGAKLTRFKQERLQWSAALNGVAVRVVQAPTMRWQ